MRQIVQEPGSGTLDLQRVPRPQSFPGAVTVRTITSAISSGTERAMIEMGRKGLLAKARARPDLVKKVIRKGRQEGWLNALQTARSRLERPRPLGYSAAGIVDSVGSEIRSVKPGDRVAIAGTGYANHAEVNVVPANLVASVPDVVSMDEAAYTTIAAIALQGVRLADPGIGDRVVVVGLGLVGLIAMQLARAAGARVVGIDPDAGRVSLGRELGMEHGVVLGQEDPGAPVGEATAGRGADAVVIAAATSSSQPVEMAGELARSKGRVVVVGNVGMEIPRQTYYEKELTVTVSRSYGPGRYDPSYEEGGIDYPVDYVRWTEQRNMEAVLDLLEQERIDLESLTTHRFPFHRALEAYDLIQDGSDESTHLGVLLEYDDERDEDDEPVIRLGPMEPATLDVLGVSFVGAGKYASTHLLPPLSKRSDVRLVGLVSGSGPNARKKAEKFGFEFCASEFATLLEQDDTDAVFIATRHASHAELTARALEAGKHVFVEKPLAVTEDQLEEVRQAFEAANADQRTGLMVGLNRRFSPLVQDLRAAVPDAGTSQIFYRVNSGHIAPTSWMHRSEHGGGMLVGEMCHFVDLMMYLASERPEIVAVAAPQPGREDIGDEDNVSMSISFSEGSLGTLFYTTLGSKAVEKERLEVYRGGTAAWLEDFRQLVTTKNGSSERSMTWRQDKGREEQIAETVEGFRLRARAPIPPDDLFRSMRAIFAARRSLQSGDPERVEGSF